MTLDTSHNPYLSAPQAVADHLQAVAQPAVAVPCS
jgi:hypothetical protein